MSEMSLHKYVFSNVMTLKLRKNTAVKEEKSQIKNNYSIIKHLLKK